VHDDLARLTAIGDVGEQRRRARVVVPHIVVHFLEVPLVRARLQIERENRRREQVVAAAILTVVVRAGVADWYVDGS